MKNYLVVRNYLNLNWNWNLNQNQNQKNYYFQNCQKKNSHLILKKLYGIFQVHLFLLLKLLKYWFHFDYLILFFINYFYFFFRYPRHSLPGNTFFLKVGCRVRHSAPHILVMRDSLRKCTVSATTPMFNRTMRLKARSHQRSRVSDLQVRACQY